MRIRYMKARIAHANRIWEKHKRSCDSCEAARSAATMCPKGREICECYAKLSVDLEAAEASKRGLSYTAHMAGGVR